MKNKVVKKVLSVALALAMMAGLMTGCGSSSNETAGEEVSTNEVQPEKTEEEDATGEALQSGEPVELRMIMYGDMTTRRDEFFKNEFHDAVLEQLNIDLTIEMLPWGSDTTTVSTMLASGEDFAVYCILANYDWAGKGYLAKFPMDSIEKLMPEYLAMRGDNDFSCVLHEGEVYTIPFGSIPRSGNMYGYEVRNDILKEVGYEASEITTYEELTAAFDAVKAAYPNLRTCASTPQMIAPAVCGSDNEYFTNIGAVLIDDISVIAAINELEEGDTVYSFVETEYFKDLCNLSAEWLEKGYTNEDLLTNPTQPLADWYAGQCLSVYGTPGALVDTSLTAVAPESELDLVTIGENPRIKSTNYDWGFAVSAAGQEKVEDWMRLFNWMYASQENYDFCIYGVEGKDYQVNEDGSYTKLVTDNFFEEWFMSAICYKKFDPSIPAEQVERYKHLDDNCQMSKKTGFVFDSSPVSAEMAALTAAYTEYVKPIVLGFKNYDENIDEAVQKLKDAGLDAYIAEIQRQFTEFYK